MNFLREMYNYRFSQNNILNIGIITLLLCISFPIDVGYFFINTLMYSGLCYIVIILSKFLIFIINSLKDGLKNINNTGYNIPDNILDDMASEAALNYVSNIHPRNMLRRNSQIRLQEEIGYDVMNNEDIISVNTGYNRNNNTFESLSIEQRAEIENSLFSRESHVSRTLSIRNKRDIQRKYIIQLPTCSVESGDCPYCLDEMKANDNVMGICGHKYHKGCVVQHFNHCFQNNKLFRCPVCRSDWC